MKAIKNSLIRSMVLVKRGSGILALMTAALLIFHAPPVCADGTPMKAGWCALHGNWEGTWNCPGCAWDSGSSSSEGGGFSSLDNLSTGGQLVYGTLIQIPVCIIASPFALFMDVLDFDFFRTKRIGGEIAIWGKAWGKVFSPVVSGVYKGGKFIAYDAPVAVGKGVWKGGKYILYTAPAAGLKWCFESDPEPPRPPDPATGNLSGNLVKDGAFGSNESDPTITPIEKRTVGSNTTAVDQLKSAAAQAAQPDEEGLAINYDIGGGPDAGTLVAHTLGAGRSAMDVSTFSERAKNDPRMIEILNNLSELQATQIELESQRTKLAQETAPATDDAAIKKRERLEQDYQATVDAIAEKTQRAEKLHREIDTSVDEPANVE